MARYTRNFEKNGIEIYFDKKPSEKVRDYLKANGWRWSSYKRCWYNYYSDSNLDFAEFLCSDGIFEKVIFDYSNGYDGLSGGEYETAKDVLAHVRRDGYDINNLDELSRLFDNNENEYILGLCFLYGYGVPQNCDNARQYLEDAFGWMFSYDTYVRKHSLMKSSIKKEQELVVYTRLLSNYYAEIHYCGISTAQGECSMTLWVWNKIDFEIEVDLTHVQVNGLEYSDSISLGIIDEDLASCFTISIHNTKYDIGLVIRKIEFYVRVSCHETGEIFSSKKVIIEKNSTINTFSASVL